MADDSPQSKRERQKARRQERLAAEQAQSAKARRNRVLALSAVALLVVGAVGTLVAGQVQQRRDRASNITAAEGRLGDLGCTPIEEQPNLGGGHLNTPEEVAAADPEVIYQGDRPATSGPHLPQVALTGVYDDPIDERLLVHNLEHGYVHFYYDDDSDPDTVEALRRFAEDNVGDYPKMIVAPFDGTLPDDADVATVAWRHRQVCRDFDEGVALAFLDQYTSGEAAPERFLQAHTSPDQQGVIDPSEVDGPLLFPPQGEDAPTDGLTEQPEGSQEDAEGAPAGPGLPEETE